MPNSLFDQVKRATDIIVSSAALVALSPVMIGTGLAVSKNLGRPVFFRQERPGKDGNPFELVKFRTMLNVDERRGISTNEQRITPFGQKLRSTSLDELPSLWNVLKGDMSLVGPRPLLMSYLPLYSSEQMRRHEVRPGLTGLAQVSGRNSIDWEKRFELDILYVENRAPLLDLKILLLTVSKVFRREGIASDGNVVGARFEGTVSRDE